MRLRKVAVFTGIGIGIAVAGFALPLLVATEVMTRSVQRSIGKPPPEIAAASVDIRTPAKQRISGWMVHGTPGTGAVLLLHGVREDRREMVGRARFLNRLGYSALLVDLPAHGESSGDRISYGLDEAEAVRAALDYLSRTLPGEKIGVIGVSLGASSFVLSKPGHAASAVVLESMFPTMEEAVSNRLKLYAGPVGDWITPVFLWTLRQRFGIASEQIRPISQIPFLLSPVLVASGGIDDFTTPAESRRIYASANEPKELWLMDGAGHVDLHAFDPEAYETKVSAFLAKHLQRLGPAPANLSVQK